MEVVDLGMRVTSHTGRCPQGSTGYWKLIMTLKVKGKNFVEKVDNQLPLLGQDWLYLLHLNWPKMLNWGDVGDP